MSKGPRLQALLEVITCMIASKTKLHMERSQEKGN